ncbi:fibrobacter succinogenes major paralogous domain-containing protein [Rasiella sp. SM2506]|uniref:fibrobacter succinogenes major paralogous domain-containing protein n=1 Tax=Rasiella sp. SM2506 TaxID=3423914 RepID=UPI003D7B1061
MILKLSKFSIALLVLFTCTITFISCEKDDSTDDMGIDDPGDDPNATTGRFSDNISCSIIATPSSLGLNTTYTKYINCTGIPVIGSANVPDEALQIASETTEFMLTGIGSVRSKLISGGAYIILFEEGLTLNDVAESGGNQQATAGGVYLFNPGNGLNFLISPAVNLLCDASSGQAEGNIFVHELAHMIDIGGIRELDASFVGTLSTTFTNARAAGKWNNTYAATNKEEYFAEMVTIWYGSNWIGREGGDGFRNEIGTRAQLQNYDAGAYNLLNNRITSLTNVPGCREPVIDGATANCPNTVTDIDGNVYEVVNIGPMCWMKENLRTTRYKNGDPIAHIQGEQEWATTAQGAWSNYDNDPNLDTFGKLYNGIAATNPAGLCPDGWRVPTIQELNDVIQYAGGNYASAALKDVTTWTPAGTNSSGFTALPAGWRHETGFFSGMGNSTFFLSQTIASSQQRYVKSIFDNEDVIFGVEVEPTYGSSCRCIKNE